VSYDLNFWKQNPTVRLNPQEIYERLCNGEYVEGLETLPIDQIIERIRKAFSVRWTQSGDVIWECPKKAFEVYTTPQYFRVDCRGRMTGDEMNVFIDIGIEFGCPLYDPQTGVRYTG
jgi:hypothetical protein